MAERPAKETPTPKRPRRDFSDPAKDRSHLRHGLKAGKLPYENASIENTTNALRRLLEDAVLAARGTVTLSDALAISSACKWERHGLLVLWQLRKAPELKPLDRIAASREIAKASTQRDLAVSLLRIDDSADLYAALYRPTEAPTDDADDATT